jgi:hypothetical protein
VREPFGIGIGSTVNTGIELEPVDAVDHRARGAEAGLRDQASLRDHQAADGEPKPFSIGIEVGVEFEPKPSNTELEPVSEHQPPAVGERRTPPTRSGESVSNMTNGPRLIVQRGPLAVRGGGYSSIVDKSTRPSG